MRAQDFKLKPSYFYLVLLGAVFLMCLGSILFLPVFWLYQVLLVIACVFYGKSIFERYGLLKADDSIHELRFLADKNWLIKTLTHEYEVELLPDSIVTHLVIALNFKTLKESRRLSCVIFPDALLPDQFRQLLVILRMF